MLTLIIESFLGAFISNLKAKEHPYLFCFMKGCLLGFLGFILAIIYNYFKDDYLMSFGDLILFFIATQTIGIIVSVFFLLIEYVFPDKKDDDF